MASAVMKSMWRHPHAPQGQHHRMAAAWLHRCGEVWGQVWGAAGDSWLHKWWGDARGTFDAPLLLWPAMERHHILGPFLQKDLSCF